MVLIVVQEKGTPIQLVPCSILGKINKLQSNQSPYIHSICTLDTVEYTKLYQDVLYPSHEPQR
jgi:hypothetical protein